MEQLGEGQAVVVGGAGGTVQVVQMGQGGQAMMLPQAIQVAAPNGQIQVVPVSSLTSTGQQIVIDPATANTANHSNTRWTDVHLSASSVGRSGSASTANRYESLCCFFIDFIIMELIFLSWFYT